MDGIAGRSILQQLHDAAQIGDVTSVKCLFESHAHLLPIDITRRGGNTTLHTALCHNQEGWLIDYLIQNGADVNRMNTKGHCPLTLAIVHCRGSTRAVQKLIAAGATWRRRLEYGLFINLTAMDVAIQFNNENVVEYLTCLSMADMEGNTSNNDVTTTTTTTIKTKEDYKKEAIRAGYAICPICNIPVKFPTKMSRILSDQIIIEERIKDYGKHNNIGGDEGKHKQRKYSTRKYMDQLLQHSNGEAYKSLCGIEYHGLENMRLRKEISESFAVLHAVMKCCKGLGIVTSSDVPPDGADICLENIFLIDLCSGKGITTALCGVLDPGKDSNNFYLAIDRMLPHTLPHFFSANKNIEYRRRDIMVESMFDDIHNIVQEQLLHGRTGIIVGMHLCGLLSERAIDLFHRTQGVMGIVLSPCCLPKKHEQQNLQHFIKGSSKSDDSKALTDEQFKYLRWANYLKDRVSQSYDSFQTQEVRLYMDEEMHSEKNAIIVGWKLTS